MKVRMLFFLFFLFLLIGVSSADAQCAMCKMAAENGAQADGKPYLALNQGILYLAAVPYLSFSVIAFLFWRGYRRRREQEAELEA